MIFFNLLLGHLLGDFLLQPNILIKLKSKSGWGVFVHVVILTVVTAIMVYPYLSSSVTWAALIFIAGTHYAQDRVKMLYGPKSGPNLIRAFMLDQFFHILIIGCAAVLMSYASIDATEHIFFSDGFGMALLCSLVIMGPVWDMVRFQSKLQKDPKAVYAADLLGMTVRMVVVTVLVVALDVLI